MSTVEYADMAELADAHGSGPCEGSFMKVRILLSAPKIAKPRKKRGFVLPCCTDAAGTVAVGMEAASSEAASTDAAGPDEQKVQKNKFTFEAADFL